MGVLGQHFMSMFLPCGPFLEEMVKSFGVCCAVVGTMEHEHDEEGKAWPRGRGSRDSDVPPLPSQEGRLPKRGELAELNPLSWTLNHVALKNIF